MRQQVDLAVLHQHINQSWFVSQLSSARAALSRILLHDLMWEQNGEFVAENVPPGHVELRSDLLHQAAVRLRRYDALLVPVSLETLGWTRRLLASIPRGPNIPVIAVLHQIQAGGMIDLLELGMVDFVQTPVHPGELRARVLCAISRAPRRVVLRDAAIQTAQERLASRASDGYVARTINGVSQSFGEAKAQLITEFECRYVREALAMQHGNVARAAAASGKNRRAFWEIMRKHKIQAQEFRGHTE